jgi:DNA-binding PadR family transcriptional regulator
MRLLTFAGPARHDRSAGGRLSQRRAHRVEPETDLRAKRVYRLTPAGLAELRRWVLEGRFEPAVIKNTALLRTLYGHLVSGEELAARVDEHVAWIEDQIAELRRAAPGPHAQLALVQEWAIDRLAGELAASKRLSARLRSHSHH